MAKACRVLLVITPGGKATENIVDARVLAALGKKGYLINVSRGSTVNEAALIEVIALAGYYHTISFLCRGLDLPLEPYGARFPVNA